MADTKGDMRMTGVPYIEMHGHMANDEHVVDVALLQLTGRRVNVGPPLCL